MHETTNTKGLFFIILSISQAALDTKIVRSANVSAKIKQSRFSP